jgi:5-formyltetrahydrofolate cyclo-ligase
VAIPEANDHKKELRREMRRVLGSPADHKTVLRHVHDWLKGQPTLKTISTYAPLPGEVDLTSLVADMPGIRWVFPRVEGDQLVLHHVSDIRCDLEPGAFGIHEPRTTLPTVHFFHVDAFLCPGLAFDIYGGRLGRGRGFYDRMLEQARSDAVKIGVCRAEQVVADTFGEPHDIIMDRVISG